MQRILGDLKALLIVIVLMSLLYPMVKQIAQRRATTLAFQKPGDDNSAIEVAVVPIYRQGTDSDLLFPVRGYDATHIISFFGDKRGRNRLHKGIDIAAPQGSPVVAVTDGFVERVTEGGTGGKQIWLRAGSGRQYFYAHLHDWNVVEGDVVMAGDIIGSVGSTGNATTAHLHFEIRTAKREALDPAPLLFPDGEAVGP